MEGITILNSFTKEFVTGKAFYFPDNIWSIFDIFITIIGIGLITWLIVKTIKQGDPVIILFILLILVILAPMNIWTLEHEIIEEKTYYRVIADDNVKLNEFFDHYILFDKDGMIYTVRERDNND